MSLNKVIKIRNGDMLVPYYIYKCDKCGELIEEAWPHYALENTHYCWNCAFKLGVISEREYLRYSGIDLPTFHAAVNPDGKIEMWQGNAVPPWDRPAKQQRNSPKCRQWRIAVFERDNYTCQDCGARGGNLNAHHIKSFKDYPKLRYEVDNGITLCEKCHRVRHKKAVT